MFDSTVIHVRRGIILQPGCDPRRPHILMLQRAPQPTSRLDPYKWECPGGKTEEGESPLETLQREVWEECGLRVVRMSDRAYDYSRPITHRANPATVHDDPFKRLYLVYHMPVEVEPFQLGDIRLSSEHIDFAFHDLMDVVRVRREHVPERLHEESPFRLSAIYCLSVFAEDLGLFPRFKDPHPELFPKPIMPPHE